MAAPEKASFTCPNCGALYEETKVETSVPAVAMQVSCRECGALFSRREGKFAFKYRFVRKSGNYAAN
jgi:transcription elongation factor Elf1